MQERPDCQGRFADAADHHLAASLDALGDGNLTLTREQLDTAHLAQIHAHRIIGSRNIAVRQIAGGAAFFLGLIAIFIAFGIIDDGHAHLRQGRHHIINLFGGEIFGRQRGVQLIMGNKSALLADLEKRLDCLLGGISVRGLNGGVS